ncbi:phosphopantetheine-binding protein [Exiguobacterium sp. s78]|uniref:phosphopantetheine-binding protein n=1 Tax=Exiguobacterium sp. s78 TaxID=2751197 RepID=UPI001BE6C422|nr:phosphopantetheine-binding protein [Exiguobacterium sp. s78]
MSRLTIAQFEDILSEQLEWSSSVAVSTTDSLRDDLGLDSMRLIHLLLHLELEHGLVIPDEQMSVLPKMRVEELMSVLQEAIHD